MLSCIVVDFFLNNQQDLLIIQIYYILKLYMFRASSLPIIWSFLLYIPSWLCFEAVTKNLHETYQCQMYSKKTPDDGQRRCPKHVEF